MMLATIDFSWQYPWAFWVAALLLVGLLVEAFTHRRQAWVIPAVLLYVTVGVWYLGNVIQEGPENFVDQYGSSAATVALLQVVLFLVAYRGFVHYLLRKVRDPRPHASALSLLDPAVTERTMTLLMTAWAVLFIIGIIRAEGRVFAILWPPSSSTKISMFATNGVGAGIDFLVSAANYIYILLCALFGVFFVLSKGMAKVIALAMALLTWPYFFFDRARNVMLAVLLQPCFATGWPPRGVGGKRQRCRWSC